LTNTSEFGIDTLNGGNAFKKIQFFSKTNNTQLFLNNNNFNSRYSKLIDLYYSDTSLVNATNYGIKRSYNTLSNKSNNNQLNLNLDHQGVSKYMNYLNNKTIQNDSNINFSSLVNNNIKFNSSHSEFKNNFLNTNITYKFDNLKSPDNSLLASERNSRIEHTKLTNNNYIESNTTFPTQHAPLSISKSTSFDRSFLENAGAPMMQGKEEAAPNIVFETY